MLPRTVRWIRRSLFTSLLLFPGCPFFPTPEVDAAVQLQIPVNAPRMVGISAQVPLEGGAARLDIDLRHDARGKLVGEATLAGEPLLAQGALERKGAEYTYTLRLTGTSRPVQIRLAGRVGAETAGLRYAGPEGKLEIESLPVVVLQSEESGAGIITGEISVDARGKIRGTGNFTSGFGNDPAEQGTFKGKYSGTTLRLTYKAGRQTLSFKGKLNGDAFVGKLKIKAPPYRETLRDYNIPLEGALVLLPPGEDNEPVATAYKIIPLVSSGQGAALGGSLTISQVTTATGARERRGEIDLSDGSLFLRSPEPIRWPAEDELPPAATGPWITAVLHAYVYDERSHTLRDRGPAGVVFLEVTSVGEAVIAGTWAFKDDDTHGVTPGSWSSSR